jgi:hypothetical protein
VREFFEWLAFFEIKAKAEKKAMDKARSKQPRRRR